MSLDTLTLSLGGDVPLDLFSEVMSNFNSLIRNLSDEVVGPDAIEWDITKLEAGSASATIRGTYHDPDEVQRVVVAYERVGKALRDNEPIPYSSEVASSALAITSVLNGKITSVGFVTEEFEASVEIPIQVESQTSQKLTALGIVTGEVNAIWDRPVIRISVVDQLFDRVVYCYLGKDKRELAREVWGKRISVSGLVYRDPETGRPIEVRQVSEITVLGDSRLKKYKRARGIVPLSPGEESSEEVIRRLRNVI